MEISRRQFIQKLVSLGFTVVGASALYSLVACTQGDSSLPSVTSLPTADPTVAPPSSPSSTETTTAKQPQASSSSSDILVTYYSRTGNTREIARQIHEQVGGDIFEIVPVNPYPVDYNECVKLARKELDTQYRPEMEAKVENMQSYNVIFIGYPNWWGTMPMILFSFLESDDFSGKTIVPFCTHEGSRLGNSITDITRLCPNSTILDGLAVRGGSVRSEQAQNEVTKWLHDLGMAQ